MKRHTVGLFVIVPKTMNSHALMEDGIAAGRGGNEIGFASHATFTFRRRTEEKSSSSDTFSKHREKEQLWP